MILFKLGLKDSQSIPAKTYNSTQYNLFGMPILPLFNNSNIGIICKDDTIRNDFKDFLNSNLINITINEHSVVESEEKFNEYINSLDYNSTQALSHVFIIEGDEIRNLQFKVYSLSLSFTSVYSSANILNLVGGDTPYKEPLYQSFQILISKFIKSKLTDKPNTSITIYR